MSIDDCFFIFGSMHQSLDLDQLSLNTLEEIWGYSSFRPSQQEIIQHLLRGKSVIAMLSTGAGKSLCYQLPALLLEGTCLVVSPLLALMKDQVNQLRRKNIPATYLGSDLEDNEIEAILEEALIGKFKLIYLSPERLSQQKFQKQIQNLNISFLAVDEAHCISEWGQDFRISYQRISSFLASRPLQVIALTATATPQVENDIIFHLNLESPAIFRGNIKRENLSIRIQKVEDRYPHVKNLLNLLPGAGIIYTRTRREAESLVTYLNNPRVDFFHAGLSSYERHRKQEMWLSSRTGVLVATSAFGMGIDKADVRFVIHISLPSSVENYFQEIGRAGRDGEPADAILLHAPSDALHLSELLESRRLSGKDFSKFLSGLYSYLQIADGDLPEQRFNLDLNTLSQRIKLNISKIRSGLEFFHQQGLIDYQVTAGPSNLELKVDATNLHMLGYGDSYFLEMLFRTLPGLAQGSISFSEKSLWKRTGIDPQTGKERLEQLHRRNYLTYRDGKQPSLRLLIPRNHKVFLHKYGKILNQIQENRLLKWEQMQYFITENTTCRMQLLSRYFGQNSGEPCGLCDTCRDKDTINPEEKILEILQQNPASLGQIAFVLGLNTSITLKYLIEMLASGRIAMLDHRTYRLPI